MRTYKRVFLLILDSFGIGYAPDADRFGDVGANTLRSISHAQNLHIPHLCRMGLGNIDGVRTLSRAQTPLAAVRRLREASMGKDTTVGHWELAGVLSPHPFPTYPNGFAPRLIEALCASIGRGILCNRPYSGTQVINDYGEEHMRTGKPIVYTSADSVFQVAAHEQIIKVEQLYDICRKARELLTGKDAVARVIARPFVGTPHHFVRTANRRDFSLPPTGVTMLDTLCAAGRDVISVGKIRDIFAGRGITRALEAHGNADAMEVTDRLVKEDFHGLCFVNFVDFDMLYGHRQDVAGYAGAMSDFDRFLGTFLPQLREDDLLLISADHGCDPADESTDHTREYVPLLVYGKGVKPINTGTSETFADVSYLVCDVLGAKRPDAPAACLSDMIF